MIAKLRLSRPVPALARASAFLLPLIVCGVETALAIVPTYSFNDLYVVKVPSGFTSVTANASTVIYGMAPGGVAGGYGTKSTERALFWNGTSVPSDLTPTGFASTRVWGIDGAQQVGDGKGTATGNNTHALLWNGTNSAIDLHPSGFTVSSAMGVRNGQQVGHAYVTSTSDNHAMLWNGTNAAIDLNPVGFSMSIGVATDGTHQVGYGYGPATSTGWHALLWNGTNVAIDLHPANFVSSQATDVGGGEEVGFGHFEPDYNIHALLWTGTDAAIDLHPNGFYESVAYSTNGTQQVGYGAFTDYVGFHYHALLWNGTNTATDLASLLPSGFADSSAVKIDSFGNVYGVARDTDGNLHAVEWVASVPEPMLSVATVLMLATAMSRRRRVF